MAGFGLSFCSLVFKIRLVPWTVTRFEFPQLLMGKRCASFLKTGAIAQPFFIHNSKKMQTSSYLYNSISKHEIAKKLEKQ